MKRQTGVAFSSNAWPSRESHIWQPGVTTADSGNCFDFRRESTLKELAERWDNMDPERRVVITESEGEDEVYHGPDTAETGGDCLPGFYCMCCEPWTHFEDQEVLRAHEQELATRRNIFCREKKNLPPDDELSDFDDKVYGTATCFNCGVEGHNFDSARKNPHATSAWRHHIPHGNAKIVDRVPVVLFAGTPTTLKGGALLDPPLKQMAPRSMSTSRRPLHVREVLTKRSWQPVKLMGRPWQH